jgi:hypothetical protein
VARAGKRRAEQALEVEHDLEMARKRAVSEIERHEARRTFQRQQQQLDTELRLQTARQEDARQQEHLAALRGMGVDLTAYLTQARADRLIEVRGPGAGGTHLHLDSDFREAQPADAIGRPEPAAGAAE